MSGVDVLAVIDEAASNFHKSCAGVAKLKEARAAVAELIEAARVIEERIAYYARLGESADQNIEDWAYTDSSGDMARYRAALARVTGGSDGH